MKHVIIKIVNGFIQIVTKNKSGIYLDDSHKYYLIAPPLLRVKNNIPESYISGQRIYDFLTVHVGLDNSERILDFGCGDGRVGAVFARLGDTFTGIYTGLDIDKKRMLALKSLFKGSERIKFDFADVYNSIFNPNGHLDQSDFIYPYTDNSYDLIFYNSVFTHMKLSVSLHNLKEAARCLDMGGRIWATYYCLDSNYDPKRANNWSFEEPYDEGFTAYPESPETCVGYSMDSINGVIQDAGLKIVKYIPGCWKQPRTTLDQHEQDIFILEKI
jgi:SAM-dependent methyltransferase